jgi:hypothetical protein
VSLTTESRRAFILERQAPNVRLVAARKALGLGFIGPGPARQQEIMANQVHSMCPTSLPGSWMFFHKKSRWF